MHRTLAELMFEKHKFDKPSVKCLYRSTAQQEDVYGAGQFTWAGLWIVTDPPTECHQELVGAWELERGPVSRWRLPVDPDARAFEVHRPADWARLATEHPRDGSPHPEWELPGVNQHTADLSTLLRVSEQRAVRTSIRRDLVPDWRAVAEHYDGVHLSWAGFITKGGASPISAMATSPRRHG